ncbi:thiamine pyrophosphate-dependent dehydrogenase E1 component subunit alpha [Clostridium magnum]|uniref:Acetoin:2,6-dichlorophenolindophenol oxidoreductase subunit alpha n=1 Tax=Clostridium magnum DSM 2767 TaxID=1121326 RepID=A0A162QZV1_9CLOT|nr:thiamine pyrophosphate-dependent dehydrogenase E1 component subunit alpha [Clostridium magnum]KZL89209.1 acetoin:2,6-dichlorophenolindophenol oxidoreductase subunit alpha [Clostridium magnum DSM 2767]SHJ35727.1 pyruvate dehydrogenase E1 component alpha subunit [Clostridium magnum DSM 2767]
MIDKERMLWIYKKMHEIRKFELKAVELFEADKLRGSVHLYVGEEAVAATVCSSLRDIDYITSTHRGHGHCIAKGAELAPALAELMGKATGYCEGRGGSMHIADVTKGNLGANAIVGGGIPIAVGGALAAKLKGTDQVAVTFFGDGASNEGTAHEAMNLASVWKLPVIFVCENNGYGISVPQWQSTSVEDISVRSVGYNMPGYTVDGNDVLAINEVMNKALERAKSGQGPTLIECKTYRWLGHWTGDPQSYRTREEVEAWKEKCPIKRFEEYMVNNNIATAEELQKIENDVIADVEYAEKFALESPQPDTSKVMDYVFYEN